MNMGLKHAIKSFFGSLYWLAANGRWGVKKVFDEVYAGQPKSDAFRTIFREVFGDDYPEEADPCGLSSATDLRNMVKYLGVGPGQTFADLGCGRGGGGLWVARETGAKLIGVDISSVAVEEARTRIPAFGLQGRAEFRVGDFAATGLDAAGLDGAMSIDALYLVPDKNGSVHETARILRQGAKFVCTTWDVDLPMQVRDHHPLLDGAGFDVERYETIPGWEARQRGVHERILARKDQLIAEMGKDAADFWILGAQTELPRLSKMRRILIVAKKR
jgi:SAM-dependent methyltransferase